jgi:hypothetical protein
MTTEETEKAKRSTAAFPKLFKFREVEQISLVTMACPSLRTVVPPPCLPLDIKDSLKEDVRFFDGGLMEGLFDGGRIDGFGLVSLLSYARD